jgi:hypothetical protein
MTKTILLLALLSGCANETLVGTWLTEEASGGIMTRLVFKADGRVLNRETDEFTDETVDELRLRWAVEGDRLRQTTEDGQWDSATQFALDGDRMTLVAFHGDNPGISGTWRFEREIWDVPGTPHRRQIWDMVLQESGGAVLSQSFEDKVLIVRGGSWEPTATRDRYTVHIDGEPDEDYALLAGTLAPTIAIFKRQ